LATAATVALLAVSGATALARTATTTDDDADNPRLVGKVFKVTDGDSIKVQLTSGAINVRFDGIDAPESNQPHGAEAKAALTALLLNKTVELDVKEQDRYERLVAVVYVGNDLNVNAKMVQDGHAWVYRRYLKRNGLGADLCRWEDTARAARRGLWAGAKSSWIYPSDWRRWRRKQTDTVQDFSKETAAGCIAAIGKK